jgi:sugar transferase (PEP-CTERM/EpsH1 system associated)
MKIGILLSRVPYPLEKGDKLRAFHQIKELSKKHEIYLCALNTSKLHPKALEVLTPFCKEIKIIKLSKWSILINLLYNLLFTALPLQIAYFYNRSAKKKVWQFFQNHQIEHLYCQLIRVSEYVKVYPCSKTLDYMDALSRGMERRVKKAPFYLKPFIKIESTRLKRYEHFIFSAFDHKTIISKQDRDLIVHADNHKIEIIPNGVDQTFFHPMKSEKTIDILFTGNMSYPPNVLSAEFIATKILPILLKENKEIKFVIAGANPNQRVQRLASDSVKITGWVDDIRMYYARSKIFLAPMQIGTGLQNKLLEAMAMGLPSVTSNLANNALGAKPNEHILIGENAEDFAHLCLKLLNDQKLADQIAKNGTSFVNKKYNWESCTKKLEELFLTQKNYTS